MAETLLVCPFPELGPILLYHRGSVWGPQSAGSSVGLGLVGGAGRGPVLCRDPMLQGPHAAAYAAGPEGQGDFRAFSSRWSQ